MNQPVQLELPRPHSTQAQVISEAKRFNVVVAGRRFGKSVLGQDRIITTLLKGQPAALFSPSYKLAGDAWRQLQHTLAPISVETSAAERRLVIRGGGELEIWSLADNPDAGRGRGYSCVVIDEAALVADLQAAWQSIRPMLTDFRGSAWFLSTPRGAASFFHTLFQRGQDAANAEWKSWQAPTSARPGIDPAEIEAARQDLSDLAFAQEYLAQFVTWTGSVFRRITDCVGTPTGAPAVIGVDWGRVSDFTVFSVLSNEGGLIELDRFRGLEFALQRGRLEAVWRRYGSPAIVAEANSIGGPVIEQLARDGITVRPFVTTSASKATIVEQLALAFEQGTITIPNDPILIGELQAFEASALPSGLMRYAAPAGGHDDCVMALAIAWAGLGKAVRRASNLAAVESILEANAELERPSQWDTGPCFIEQASRWTQ